MKSIQYDAEGDILTLTFAETNNQPHSGVELNDNIVLYFNPETSLPIRLIMVSYRRMVEVSRAHPILLNGLNNLPPGVQAQVLHIITSEPISHLIRLDHVPDGTTTGHLNQVFSPVTLRALAA